jgi:hypothetical protein
LLPMNRVSHAFPDVATLLEGAPPQRSLEGLLVHRVGLIELLQSSLMELHEHRQRVAGTAAEAETVHRIRYWDEVLGWMKEQRGSELIVLERGSARFPGPGRE